VVLLCIFILKVQAFGEEIEDICDETALLQRFIPPFQTLLKKALLSFQDRSGREGVPWCGSSFSYIEYSRHRLLA